MSVKHSEVFKFFSKILPNEELIYHSPLPPSRPYDPTSKAGSRFIASRLILSLTPSEAVYETLNRDPRSRSILFLHRPFRLDRRRVPHGTLVLASHVRYDELLTTGWNEALADEHSIQPNPSSSTSGKVTRHCIQGHKNDPERRIGLVGLLEPSITMSSYAQTLSEAFEGHEASHLPQEDVDEAPVKALASLNAFTPEIIERILELAKVLEVKPGEVLCLTGVPREAGMQAASQAGMSVLAVGHKRCEMWGLKYLERQARKAFPDLDIRLHEADEEPRPPRIPSAGKPSQHSMGVSGGDASVPA